MGGFACPARAGTWTPQHHQAGNRTRDGPSRQRRRARREAEREAARASATEEVRDAATEEVRDAELAVVLATHLRLQKLVLL
jgi:hypothetical protein